MKISEYPLVSSLQSSDLLFIVRNVSVDPANKRIFVKDALSSLTTNTSITGNFSVSGDVNVTGNTYTVTVNSATYNNLSVDKFTVNSNGFIISDKFTPANSSIFEASSEGKISFDDNYLYVKTANNVVKRVALSTF